jgi:NADPH:quinone reductase-like Zn-dependent oxidoreductase
MDTTIAMLLLVEGVMAALVLGIAVKKPKIFFVLVLAASAAAGVFLTGGTPVAGSGLVGGRGVMRAAYFSPGAPHNVEVKDSIPIPSSHMANQVLVEVIAAGLNPSNFKINLALIPIIRHFKTFVVGYDFAGVVLSVGSNEACQGIAVGDKIYGVASSGSMAEYATAMCGMVGRSPRDLTDTQVAGLPVAALTSLEALHRGGVLQGQAKGKRILVIGASGGTGVFGVSIGKALGAHVTGVCSARTKQFVQALGPDRLVDYTSAGGAEIAALIAEGRQFDMIYDTVTSFAPEDPDYEPSMRPLLVQGGKYVAINGYMMDWTRGIIDNFVLAPILGVRGLAQRKDYELFLLQPHTELINELTELFDKKLLTEAPVDATFPLDQDSVYQAFVKMKGRRTKGKIVITVR